MLFCEQVRFYVKFDKRQADFQNKEIRLADLCLPGLNVERGKNQWKDVEASKQGHLMLCGTARQSALNFNHETHSVAVV